MTLSRREFVTIGGATLAGSMVAPARARAETPKRGGTLTIPAWDPPL